MVNGLERLLAHIRGFESHYFLIGGTACAIWMGEYGLEFRSTKDLDIVLLADALPEEFLRRFWAFIREGQYGSLERRSESPPSLYRFKNPRNPEHPFMIELFSRNFLPVDEGFHLTPIPGSDDISSLSAILLADEYFGYLVDSRVTIGGVPTIPVECLIPMKARACLDLAKRKAAGEPVDNKQISKHRNDVFRLYRTLVPNDRFAIPAPIQSDLAAFLEKLPPESQDWQSIRDSVGGLPESGRILAQLRENFGLIGGFTGT